MQIARYDADFYSWCMEQARFLENGDLAHLDLEHLKEEIESMGKRDFRELKSRFAVLICHLLKWTFQPERQSASWQNTINEQRDEIQSILADSPSLRVKAENVFLELWKSGVKKAAQETGLARELFPDAPLWDMGRIVDDDFWPDK